MRHAIGYDTAKAAPAAGLNLPMLEPRLKRAFGGAYTNTPKFECPIRAVIEDTRSPSRGTQSRPRTCLDDVLGALPDPHADDATQILPDVSSG